jgi:membrane protease YdiL (CAAX protease family)
VCFWYAVLRPSAPVDVVFLALLAAIVLLRILESVYTSPINVRIDILGRLMLIRTGAMAALELRRTSGTGFGFVPSQKEWVTGVRYFFYFVPVGFPLALWLGLVHLTFNGFLFWKTLATFFGVLWVLALAEEFFFRGLLQNWLTEWMGRPHAAIIIASILFGAVHLQFRSFPNWRFALVSAVAGVFYGLAYQKAGSVRAAMVTHALVVTTLRTIFV